MYHDTLIWTCTTSLPFLPSPFIYQPCMLRSRKPNGKVSNITEMNKWIPSSCSQGAYGSLTNSQYQIPSTNQYHHTAMPGKAITGQWQHISVSQVIPLHHKHTNNMLDWSITNFGKHLKQNKKSRRKKYYNLPMTDFFLQGVSVSTTDFFILLEYWVAVKSWRVSSNLWEQHVSSSWHEVPAKHMHTQKKLTQIIQTIVFNYITFINLFYEACLRCIKIKHEPVFVVVSSKLNSSDTNKIK